MTPLFLADWCDAAFMHMRVPAAALQRSVPFELDLYDGGAFVSLVAFTQKQLRFSRGGAVAAMLTSPISQHEFLNVRTYVRHEAKHAIYFIAEWIPNRLAVLLGPGTYGLPYRLGQLNYDVDQTHGQIRGAVSAAAGAIEFLGEFAREMEVQCAKPGSLDEFLLERYAAFTDAGHRARRFEIEHARWTWRTATIELRNDALLRDLGDWSADAELISAHYSSGVHDVKISWPLHARSQRRRLAGAHLYAAKKPMV